MDVVEILTGYVEVGVEVLPLHKMYDGMCSCGDAECRSPAKHPLTRNGKDDATTDLGTIAEWLARWPGCNWGGRPPVGVVVLDVDPRNDGHVHLAELERTHAPLPATLTAQTGSGGLHHWLSYNGPTRGRLCAGVDVKANSGYLVLPPSVHASGGRYFWLDESPAAYAPDWVKAILNPPVRHHVYRPGRSGVEQLVRFVAESVDGERNKRLYWAACRAHERGLDPAPLVDAAVAVGLDQRDAVATVNSASKAASR